MKGTLVVAALSLGLLVLGVRLVAHHSFSAEYDSNKPITLKGAVTKVEWTNPHAWIYLNVRDESGKLTEWSAELGSPNLLTRAGWTSKSLKVGDQITIEAFMAKDGSKMANVRLVTLADGRQVFGGSSSGNTPIPPRQK
jgi:hypothetical protein